MINLQISLVYDMTVANHLDNYKVVFELDIKYQVYCDSNFNVIFDIV